MNKVNRLQELGELLKSGAITKEEFENLKKEILQPLSKHNKNPKLIELEELLNSEAITQEEFNKLKDEIINPDKTEQVPLKDGAGSETETALGEWIKQKKKLYNDGSINLKEISEFRKQFDENLSQEMKMNNPEKKSIILASKFLQERETSTDYETKTTDIFASISLAAGVGGFLILPIIFVPIGYIASIISYYRIKENNNLKGSGMRIIGAILTSINIFWLMYQFQIGPFSNS
jgi:hypothetical protein